MDYRCARCHTRFSVADGEEPHACPTCKAEAGLEPLRGIPAPMALFGVFLGFMVVASLVGVLLPAVLG